ncbi:DUF3127 domain-containing protein [Arachidicoccus soli]|uniref:DUF3127 domain-containing protein n=1 Tax=Arachidicoccus soli TaxID=2341117 RepID=A0A386HPG2_9BACT|nr:DUF3127 domain-containing protein [Arachidicoccus soli]AYD47582.1 DUF3127 domain-containing protein [Arachidicoccus soli]
MAYEVIGKLVAKYDTMQRSETFKTREFVIEKSDDIGGRIITNYIKFQCVQDKTALPDKFNIGDELKVSFNLKGSKWSKDGRENYITNLDAWRLEQAGSLAQNMQQNTSSTKQDFVPDADPGDVVDDLPF